MRRIRFVFTLLFIMFWMQVCQAGIVNNSISEPKPPLPGFPLKLTTAPAVASANKAEVTNVRWSSFVDAKGTSLMRLVFDLSGPAEATGMVTRIPTPRLILTVKGVNPGKLESIVFDENIVDKANVIVNGDNTYIILELPKMITTDDFKVFTLPEDQAAGKAFRVVADIKKKSSEPGNSVIPPVVIKQDGKPVAPSTLNSDNLQVPAGPELTDIRWAYHTDFFTGHNKLRLVLESASPIEAESALSGTPVPQLAVTIKGAGPGRIDRQIAFGGKVIDKVTIMPVNANTTKMVIDLPLMLEPADYKMMILPGDPKLSKPYRLVVDINKKLPPMDYKFTAGLKNKLIVIDPGHGGSDPGAIGANKTQEKAVTFAVAQKVKLLLEKAGAKVTMTREDDRDVYPGSIESADELKARTAIANNIKADLFISIHADAFTNPASGGTTSYYYEKTGYDAMLGQNIQSAIIQAGGLQNRGAKSCNFYVVKRTIMPAALIELAFISNPSEEKLLNSPQFQLKMAQGIVKGLDNFFSQAAKHGGGQ